MWEFGSVAEMDNESIDMFVSVIPLSHSIFHSLTVIEEK